MSLLPRLVFVWWSPIERCTPEDGFDAAVGLRRPRIENLGPFPSDGPFKGHVYRARVLLGWLEVRVDGPRPGPHDNVFKNEEISE